MCRLTWPPALDWPVPCPAVKRSRLATGVRGLYRAMHAVDVLGTQRLLEHAGRAGVRHFLYISIVGVDQIPFGYYSGQAPGRTADPATNGRELVHLACNPIPRSGQPVLPDTALATSAADTESHALPAGR